jgi:hypothetical protein
VLCVSDGDHGMDFFDQFLLFVIIEVHVPLRQASFASSVLNQDKPNLREIMSVGLAHSYTI